MFVEYTAFPYFFFAKFFSVVQDLPYFTLWYSHQLELLRNELPRTNVQMHNVIYACKECGIVSENVLQFVEHLLSANMRCTYKSNMMYIRTTQAYTLTIINVV